MRRATVLLFGTALFVGSCAGGANTVGSAERSVAPEAVDALVVFEADWQCERQRHAFDELEDLADRLDATRDAAGISADDYDIFQEMLEEDVELRQRVLAAFRVECA